jgi:hypothetical protein
MAEASKSILIKDTVEQFKGAKVRNNLDRNELTD